jgi:hypothetical protein
VQQRRRAAPDDHTAGHSSIAGGIEEETAAAAWAWVAQVKHKDKAGGSETSITVATDTPSEPPLPPASSSSSSSSAAGQMAALCAAVTGGGRQHALSPSQLKSALQKNVRRGRPDEAVRCAAAMALGAGYPEGLNQLLRRLIIIVLEDCILHPALPCLVWLLLAVAKGFIPTAVHVPPHAELATTQECCCSRD